MSYFLKHGFTLFSYRGLQTIPHSERLTTTIMASNGEATFNSIYAEEDNSLYLFFIIPLSALVAFFAVFMFCYCRMKCKKF